MLRPALAAATLACAGCYFDPGNTPVVVGERQLDPTSVVFGRTYYESDAWILENRYHVTWVVVTDQEDACAVFTANAACDGDTPAGPARPDGRQLDILFNSFSEDARTELGETQHSYDARFMEVEGGVVTHFDEGTSGTLSSPHVDGDRAFGRYSVVFESGASVSGTFSATRCPAMDDLLWKQLKDRDRCP